jgi:phage N-6-adenine-methyltransferase
MARQVLGKIDIDPASNAFANQTVQATTYYTKEDDGLSKEWQGKMWLNPPYSSIIAKFIDKTCKSDVEAIVLTNNSTDTKWFAQAANTCDAICFTYGRINFYDETDKKSSPTNGQSFFYFGDNIDKFNQVFKKIGFVVKVL